MEVAREPPPTPVIRTVSLRRAGIAGGETPCVPPIAGRYQPRDHVSLSLERALAGIERMAEHLLAALEGLDQLLIVRVNLHPWSPHRGTAASPSDWTNHRVPARHTLDRL